MKRFKNILLFAGGEVSPAPAIARGAALAKANAGRLTLIDVLPEDLGGPWMTLPGRPDFETMLAVARRDELEELAAPLRKQGIEVKTRVLTGRPFVELIYEVQRRGHDLIMKTAQGSGGALGGLLGSTAFHLLRKCPCPVWVVKPEGTSTGRVVAAIDPDLSDPSGDKLSRTVLELGSSLARSRGLELEIVHVWRLWSEPMLRSRRLNVPSEEVDAIVDGTRKKAEAAVQEVIAQVDLAAVPRRVSVVEGVPFEVVSEYARTAEVAVLGTLSRAGIAGVLIGNTAERILRQIDCSVIAVKPEGFETPIQLPTEDLEKIA